MGTIFAPTYANLTMGYFEVHVYDICEVKWERKFKEFPIENWGRFSVDCETTIKKKNNHKDLLDTINSNEAI